MECMEGRNSMKAKQYTAEIGGTATCTVRLLEAVMHDNDRNRGILGDSWFGSVRAAAKISDWGKRAILCVSLILCNIFMTFSLNYFYQFVSG